MKIIIQNSSVVPIYQQIYEQIKESIIMQELKEGELLPSIRQLSRELKVSVITTTRAYTELESDGYIIIVQGRGCFVQKLNRNNIEDKLLKNIEENFIEIMKWAKLLNKTNEDVMIFLKNLMEELEGE